MHARLQPFDRARGGEAEIEQHAQLARNHVGGTGAGLHVGDLERGGRKVLVAGVPVDRGELGQRGRGQVHRIARQVRVGDVTLDARAPADRPRASRAGRS